jgi:molybdopterin synthase catalytic subunit
MQVRVLFFGMLRELVGRPADEADFPPGASLASVFQHYAARYPRLQELAASIVIARNREFADTSTLLAEGDEVAFLPPVSGGADSPVHISEAGHYFALTRHAIDSHSLSTHLLTGAEGAVVTFEGTVRNHTGGRATLCLDYEGYEPMALKMMAQIGLALAADRKIERIAMVHRLGRMLIGDTSVAIVVSAAHRRPAFEAALEAIDQLKKRVPIWKKEHFLDGEVWVEGAWDQNVPVAG